MNRTIKLVSIGITIVAGVVATATPADAASVKSKAYSVAKAQKNDPYKYGAAGPSRFDCSGLVYYSYGKVGKKLSRTAQGQYNGSRHIGAGSRQVGDLVFFGASSKKITHVGVYAGSGKIYNANTGSYRGYKVVLAPISEYTRGKHVYYGQVK